MKPRFDSGYLLNKKVICNINNTKCPGGGMVDMYALGAYVARRVGSSPTLGTKLNNNEFHRRKNNR